MLTLCVCEFRKVANAALQELHDVVKRYEYFRDIQNLFHDSWGGFQMVLWESIVELTEALHLLPIQPDGLVVRLCEPQAEKFMKGVHLFGGWVTETKAIIARRVGELSSH